MELTRRQREFLYSLLDLYREGQGPFHYTLLARRLQVSRFTAYDMLRLLEDKGMVTSSYQLSETKSGPGRSEIVFTPTDKARRLIAQLAGDIGDDDWQRIKERALKKIQSGDIADRELAMEMFARLPLDRPVVIRYCTELITIIVLRLKKRGRSGQLLDYLPDILSASDNACRPNLTYLGGFAFGLLVKDAGPDRGLDRELLTHVMRYQALVIDMEPFHCRQLAASLNKVLAMLREV